MINTTRYASPTFVPGPQWMGSASTARGDGYAGSATNEVTVSKTEVQSMRQQIQRNAQWTAKLQEIGGLADGLGLGLDEHIKDTVAALQVNGFSTRQSCHGHIDWGCGAPWVDIQAPSQPKKLFGHLPNSLHVMSRFNGHEQAFEKVASQHGISVAEVLSRDTHEKYLDVFREANVLAAQNGDSPEYSKWTAENRLHREAMETILKEYNSSKLVAEGNLIKFMPFGDDSFRIYTGSEEDLFRKTDSLSEADKQALGLRLEVSRQRMNEFATFLKDRFLAGGPVLA